jgi:hypothetical protein
MVSMKVFFNCEVFGGRQKALLYLPDRLVVYVGGIRRQMKDV